MFDVSWNSDNIKKEHKRKKECIKFQKEMKKNRKKKEKQVELATAINEEGSYEDKKLLS